MDFQYNFRQAYNDRLEDAGIKRYGYQNTNDCDILEQDNPKRKSVTRQIKQGIIASMQLLVK